MAVIINEFEVVLDGDKGTDPAPVAEAGASGGSSRSSSGGGALTPMHLGDVERRRRENDARLYAG